MDADLKKRHEIPLEFTWNLEKMYSDLTEYEKDFSKIKALQDNVLSFKGRLGESPEMLKGGIEAVDVLMRTAEKVYTYAHLRSDEDTANNENKGRVNKISAVFAEVSGATAFFTPEIMAIDDKTMDKFLASECLSFYRRSLLELLRFKTHILTEKEERIIGLYSDVLGAGEDIYSVFSDADMDLGKIIDEDGKKVTLSQGNYRKFLESKNRVIRKRAFDRMFKSHEQFRNTFSATLENTVKKHCVSSKLHNYSSCLEAALADDNIKNDVYLNLIKTVHENLGLLDEYLKLRKKVLKLETLDMYDLYNPLVDTINLEYSFDEAKKIVKAALRPLGEEYGKLLERSFNERWIDVMENKGKRSGAYSSGCYDSYPYLLLNFNGQLNDVFTLAHELGHSLHSFYSNQAQHYHYADYSIFVAEVASTTNEILLSRYLLEHTDNVKLKLYLLGHLADEIRTTVYRQTMFAEFELKMHELSEKNTPLSADLLCEEYGKINKFYYGREVKPSKLIEMEWARIPHFYYNFYVYKYATGMSAAIALAENILSGDAKKIEAYFGFLKAGDSKDVLDIMKDAGVDLSTPQPIQSALEFFGRTVEAMKCQLEKL